MTTAMAMGSRCPATGDYAFFPLQEHGLRTGIGAMHGRLAKRHGLGGSLAGMEDAERARLRDRMQGIPLLVPTAVWSRVESGRWRKPQMSTDQRSWTRGSRNRRREEEAALQSAREDGQKGSAPAGHCMRNTGPRGSGQSQMCLERKLAPDSHQSGGGRDERTGLDRERRVMSDGWIVLVPTVPPPPSLWAL